MIIQDAPGYLIEYLFAIDYFQIYGHDCGVVRGTDRTHEISGAHGVCETCKARL